MWGLAEMERVMWRMLIMDFILLLHQLQPQPTSSFIVISSQIISLGGLGDHRANWCQFCESFLAGVAIADATFSDTYESVRMWFDKPASINILKSYTSQVLRIENVQLACGWCNLFETWSEWNFSLFSPSYKKIASPASQLEILYS